MEIKKKKSKKEKLKKRQGPKKENIIKGEVGKKISTEKKMLKFNHDQKKQKNIFIKKKKNLSL